MKKTNRRKNVLRRRLWQRYKILVFVILILGLILAGILCAKKLTGSTDDSQDAQDAFSEDIQDMEQGNLDGQDIEPDLTPVPVTPKVTEAPEPVQITISTAGDCTLGTDEYFDSDTSFVAKYNAVGDPGYFFREVRHVFEADDLTIVNFEGTLTTGGERKDKTYAFKGDPSYTAILTEGSVEAVNLANNHSFDYGQESYDDTKRYLTEAGIVSFGYDRNAIMDIKGVKVGLIGIYELAKGIESADLLRENIANVKAEGAQLIIVSFHWGTEKEHYPDNVQKELAHIAIDEGAHLVVGHHPHVLQGIEEYNGRNIVYSLGNFCFGGNKNPSDKDTMIFQQTFTVAGDVVQEDNMKNIIPCSLSSRSDFNNYQPMVLDGEEKQRVMERIEEYSSGLSD